MKILFVVPYVPNLIRVRPYNMIKSLSDLGNDVTVLTLFVNQDDQKDIERLKAICSEVIATKMPVWRSLLNSLKALFTKSPLQSFYSWNPALIDLVPNIENFDVVHVEHLRGSKYALHIKENYNVPVVWDSVDCISHLFDQAQKQTKSFFGSLITKLDLNRTKIYEGWLIHQFSKVLVTSQVDKEALENLSEGSVNDSQICVLPNGVDLEYFQPDPNQEREVATLVVTGKMSYHANVTMVLNLIKKIMPMIWETKPNVKLYVVGKDPSSDIQEAGKDPNIVVTGTVDDMRPYLHKATVAVAPVVYGAGIQNKVLEAMACGTPVVTTTQSAQSIAAIPDKEFCVAENNEAFAHKTLALLNDNQYASEVGEAGYAFMKRNHDWEMIAAKLEEVYDGIIYGQRQLT